MRQLDKFVRSPIHNQHEEVIRLFQYLRRHLNGHEKGLDKEKVFANLYPRAEFNMQQLHYVSSYLIKVVEDFLAWHEWKNNQYEQGVSLLRALRNHKLDAMFDQAHQKQVEKLAGTKKQDTRSLLLDYQLEWERFNQDRLNSTKQSFRLQELSDSLDAYFLAEKLRSACILMSNQNISKSSYDMGLLPKIIEHIEESNRLNEPIIAIYFHAYRTLIDSNDIEAYKSLKSVLKNNCNPLEINELHDIYIFAINFCIRQLNSGEQDFMREVFEVYQLGLNSNVFIQNGILTPRSYSNIVMAGLKLKEYDWVGQFVEEYKPALPEKQREGFYNYNLARLYYEQRKFALAMPLLLQMEYDDVLLTSLGKVLLAKMYFEQQEFESLSSLLSSFRVYIQRKKMPGSHHESHHNFIQFLGKLMFKSPNASNKLKNDILDTKVVAEKEWLLAQL